MDKEDIAKNYAKCKGIPRERFINHVSDEVAKSFGDSYDLLPLYEHGMFKHAFMEHYSLKRNQHLACRWREYKMNIETKVFAPFQLPDIKELHFHNHTIRYRPEDSISRQDHRQKLKPGPGVDHVGAQRPIPQELQMKRGGNTDAPVNVKGKKAGKGKTAKARNSKDFNVTRNK